jgi:hypothetical protein
MHSHAKTRAIKDYRALSGCQTFAPLSRCRCWMRILDAYIRIGGTLCVSLSNSTAKYKNVH